MQRFQLSNQPFFLFAFVAANLLVSNQVLLALPQATAGHQDSLVRARQKGAAQSAYLGGKKETLELPELKVNLERYKKDIQPLLSKACWQCHGSQQQEGNIRVDTLDPDLIDGEDVQWWLEIFAVVNNSEMPPPEDNHLSEEGRVKILNWLTNELKQASLARKNRNTSTSFRRMTRYEFNYALQDLLGLRYDFARDLPPEVMQPGGFKNSSGSLRLSRSQLESFRRVARQALDRALVVGDRPKPLFWDLPIKVLAKIDWEKQKEEIAKSKEKHKDDPQNQKKAYDRLLEKYKKQPSRPAFKDLKSGRHVQASWAYYGAKYCNRPSLTRKEMPEEPDCVAIIPQGRNQKLTVELGDSVPDEGTMRVKVRAAKASQNDLDRPSLRIEFGFQASNEGRSVLKVGREITPIDSEQYKFYQWDIPLGDIYPRNSVRGRYSLGAMPSPSEFIKIVNDSMSEGAVLIDYIEIEAPVFEKWPPSSHDLIFKRSTPVSQEVVAAEEIFSDFMEKAWRRPLSQDEVARKIALFQKIRPLCDSFEEAVGETLSAVIASPHFIYLGSPVNEGEPISPQNPRKLNAHELASRLSFFLWCSLPDEELRQLADSGKLLEKKVLDQQVNRMLADPRINRLSKHFVHQWLDLEMLEFVNFAKTYRGLDPELKPAMLEEPVKFFEEIMHHNRSVLDFIHADYLMVNSRLATHYGMPNIKGNHFRPVKAPNRLNRGGLLTSAGILTMNSDGKDSHPLKRGVWILEKILNDPPPPPPPAVPEIDLSDPSISKMSLKERIENHRDHAACMSCHVKIDPWGIAFENFDASGRWRTRVGKKEVDATSYLFNREKLEGINGLKKYLLENRQDQFVRGLVNKMTSFAIGRPLTFEDHSDLEAITFQTRRQKDGLADMITAIVGSDLFLAR